MSEQIGVGMVERELDRHWLRWAMLAWAIIAVICVWQRWGQIYWLGLGDTDDNMRLMQVRGLLTGQGWYDLTQYRLNPPTGFNIHWSRLVDLPIAALILILRPLAGTGWAERLACGIAPLLPLAVTIGALAFTVRRLIAPVAWPVSVVILATGCTGTMLMYMPMRVDHHGWQLAFLALTVAGLAHPRRALGGAIVGGSSACSLTIGLEMLPYCAMAGAILTLRWVWAAQEARRLQVYALTLGGGSAIGFALFASNANHAMRCDALTPVWLSVMVAAGALLFVLARVNPAPRGVRFGMAVAAGAAIAGGFVALFPQCLARPEGVSDELARTWLNNVREAKPIYEHPFRVAFPLSVLPILGIAGGIIGCMRSWRDERLNGWAPVALFTAFAAAMLLWQVRAGPAAQMLSVPGATMLAWIVVPWCLASRFVLVRVFGSVTAFLAVSGLFAGFVVKYLPSAQPTKRVAKVNRAAGRCGTLPAMRVLDRFPAATMFTHVDLGPRLIVMTHHYAIAGPYHRNGDAILDVHHAFTGPTEGFRPIARRHGATYLLTCPNIAESTVYRFRNPNGFYAHLAKGEVPGWLIPVPLPAGSPLKLWRIDYGK